MALLKHENGPFDITIGDKKGQQNTDSILEMTPTVAQKISVFLGYFSAVELLTPCLLSEILPISDEAAIVILGAMRSYSIKLDIIEESLRVSAEKPKNAELIKLILSELRWFNGERNKYAHAIYIGTGKIGVVRRRAFHSDTQRNYHECELDTEDVEMQIERAKKLHITMYHHLLPHGSFDTRP